MANLIGDELLISIFAQYGSDSNFKIIDESDIVKAFYLSHDKYPNLFTNYSFDNDGVFPDSRELTDAFDALMQSRMIGRLNPDLKKYYISEAVLLRYNKFIKPKLKDDLVKDIENLANEIAEALSINNRTNNLA